jgi:hypothetical protein
MFRPNWPSSGVEIVAVQESAAHCNPVLFPPIVISSAYFWLCRLHVVAFLPKLIMHFSSTRSEYCIHLIFLDFIILKYFVKVMNYEPLITQFSACTCYFLFTAVTWFLPRKLGFSPRVVYLRFVDKVAMAKVFLRTARFSPADYHFTLAPYSSSTDR